MERLTDKNHNAINKCGDYSSCYSCRKEICYISELEQKLGELEDVLESWHIENLEELKTRLHDCQVYHLENNSNETLIHNLKNELAELKQKAIVPKFKVGQEIYYIYGNEIRSMFVSTIEISKNLIGYHSLRDFAQFENNCFATKEEAEQKLAEIGGKDD